MPGLLDLANELVLAIANAAVFPRDFSVLSKVNKQLYQLLNPALYRADIVDPTPLAMLGSIVLGNRSALEKCIAAGASIDRIGTFFDSDPPEMYHAAPLSVAIDVGNITFARLLLENGANVKGLDKCEYDLIPLDQAAKVGNLEVVELLCKYGADPSIMGAEEGTVQKISPLHTAASEGHTDILKYMHYAAKVDMNLEKEVPGDTPLKSAIRGDHVEMMEFLWSLEEVRRFTSYDIQLENAAKMGFMPTVEILLGAALPDKTQRQLLVGTTRYASGKSCLDFHQYMEKENVKIPGRLKRDELNTEQYEKIEAAFQARKLNYFRTVLSSEKVSPVIKESIQWTEYRQLCETGTDEQIVVFLEHGFAGKDYRSLLSRTVEAGRANTVGLLIDKYGADPNVGSGDWPPLIQAAFYNKEDSFKALVAGGADLRLKTPEGTGVLHLAAKHNTSLTRFVLEQGADPNEADPFEGGNTPFHNACAFDDMDRIKLLLSYGADKDLRTSSGTSLFDNIAKCTNEAFIREFLEYFPGIEEALKPDTPRSPLHQAALFSSAACRVFLERGADINRLVNGLSPLEFAVQIEHTESIQTLMEYNPDPYKMAKDHALHHLCSKFMTLDEFQKKMSPYLSKEELGDAVARFQQGVGNGSYAGRVMGCRVY